MAEAVAATLDRQRVRRCLDGLTGLQRESIELAYYGEYMGIRRVAQLLGAALGTVKTRIRDGMIRDARLPGGGVTTMNDDVHLLAVQLRPGMPSARLTGTASSVTFQHCAPCEAEVRGYTGA